MQSSVARSAAARSSPAPRVVGCHAKIVTGNRRWAGVRTLCAAGILTNERATERP